MKKIFCFILFTLFSFSIFAEWKKIATTYGTNLSYNDIVEIFIEEINKPHYENVLWYYQVFTDEKEQNYAWSVKICTDGYKYDNDEKHADERSLILCTNNGCIEFHSFSISTRRTINGITESSNTNQNMQIRQMSRVFGNYLDESNRWLKRYGYKYNSDQLKAFDKFFKEYCDSTADS